MRAAYSGGVGSGGGGHGTAGIGAAGYHGDGNGNDSASAFGTGSGTNGVTTACLTLPLRRAPAAAFHGEYADSAMPHAPSPAPSPSSPSPVPLPSPFSLRPPHAPLTVRAPLVSAAVERPLSAPSQGSDGRLSSYPMSTAPSHHTQDQDQHQDQHQHQDQDKTQEQDKDQEQDQHECPSHPITLSSISLSPYYPVGLPPCQPANQQDWWRGPDLQAFVVVMVITTVSHGSPPRV